MGVLSLKVVWSGVLGGGGRGWWDQRTEQRIHSMGLLRLQQEDVSVQLEALDILGDLLSRFGGETHVFFVCVFLLLLFFASRQHCSFFSSVPVFISIGCDCFVTKQSGKWCLLTDLVQSNLTSDVFCLIWYKAIWQVMFADLFGTKQSDKWCLLTDLVQSNLTSNVCWLIWYKAIWQVMFADWFGLYQIRQQ